MQPVKDSIHNPGLTCLEPPSSEQKLLDIAAKAAQLSQSLKYFLGQTKTEALKTVPLTLLLETTNELGTLAEQVAKIGYQLALTKMKLEKEESEDDSLTSSFDPCQHIDGK